MDFPNYSIGQMLKKSNTLLPSTWAVDKNGKNIGRTSGISTKLFVNVSKSTRKIIRKCHLPQSRCSFLFFPAKHTNEKKNFLFISLQKENNKKKTQILIVTIIKTIKNDNICLLNGKTKLFNRCKINKILVYQMKYNAYFNYFYLKLFFS